MSRICKYCEYTTNNSSTLSMHISMKHRRVFRHRCPYCYVVFIEKTQLEHHIMNNHTDKNIECPFDSCDKIFRTKTTMKIHYVRKHLKNRELFGIDSFGELFCYTCREYFKNSAMYYHQAICSKYSPFSEKYDIFADESEISPKESENEGEKGISHFQRNDFGTNFDMDLDKENTCCSNFLDNFDELPINVMDNACSNVLDNFDELPTNVMENCDDDLINLLQEILKK